jgi:membrane-associated HD superfamily phosphohydrolase
LWPGNPHNFNAIFGRYGSPIEAAGYKYAAAAYIGIIFMASAALLGNDRKKRETLQIGTFVWMANLLSIMSLQDLYDVASFNYMTLAFIFGALASFIGGFLMPAAEKRKRIKHRLRKYEEEPLIVDEDTLETQEA